MASEIRQRTQSSKMASQQPLLSKSDQDSALLSFDELPEWGKDNEYLHKSFRPVCNSYWECVKSMGQLHTETGNIYTHLLAAVWMFVLGGWYYRYATTKYPQVGRDDFMVFFLYFLGGALTYLFSSGYHVLASHSKEVHDFCHKLDYLGIIVGITGTFPPGLWYTFPCAGRVSKWSYIYVDLYAQLAISLVILFVRRFRSPKYRPIRAAAFTIIASSAYYPIWTSIIQNGWAKANHDYAASWYFLSIIVYLISVVIYGARVPERWFPGKFDIWGQSHQIFHIGTATGHTIQFVAFAIAADRFYDSRGGKC